MLPACSAGAALTPRDRLDQSENFPRAVFGAVMASSRAIAVARLLTELYPSFARAYVTLGRALAANGERSAASAAFATALRLDSLETRAIEWNRRVHP